MGNNLPDFLARLPRRDWRDAVWVPASEVAVISEDAPPNQIACCQGAFFEAQSGSKGARFLSTPWQGITSLRMHAPTAAIFGFEPSRVLTPPRPPACDAGPWQPPPPPTAETAPPLRSPPPAQRRGPSAACPGGASAASGPRSRRSACGAIPGAR